MVQYQIIPNIQDYPLSLVPPDPLDDPRKLQTLYYLKVPIHQFVYKNLPVTIAIKSQKIGITEMNTTKLLVN